jgi:hypothetical protein
MQKFTLLAVGDTFEFRGVRYIKAGPLTARELEGGGQRMIPRSALVTPLGETAPTPAEVEQRMLPAAQVVAAFEDYHRGCLEWLQLIEERDAETAKGIRKALQTARERFLAELDRL